MHKINTNNITPSLQKILNNTAFAHITRPYKCFIDERKGLLAIASSFFAQWSGRHISMRGECVHLYDLHSLELLCYLDNLSYPINDIAFHPVESYLAIGIGSYDGGAYFEGKLLLWNFKDNHLQQVVEDNREVTLCKFINNGEKLQFSVNPVEDLTMDSDYVVSTYEISLPITKSVELQSLFPISTVEYKEDFNPVAIQENIQSGINLLHSFAAQKGQVYENKSIVWDIQFLDTDTLCVACNNATVELHNLQTNEKRKFTLPEAGDCVELFISRSKEYLYVHLWSRNWQGHDTNQLYQIDIKSGQCKEMVKGNYTFSKSIDDYFLARQTNYEERNKRDIIFNKDFDILYKKRLGHYDLFNHYIRIDNTKLLYFLVGKPLESHENKVLCSINPINLAVDEVYQIESKPTHYNELSGIYAQEHIILGGKVYASSRSKYDSYEVFAVDLHTKKEKWYKTYSDKASAFGLLDDSNKLIVAFTNGIIEILETQTGKTLYSFTTMIDNSFSKPLSIATIENKIAIGLTDGRVLIYTC